MSSTNRGSERSPLDFYATPPWMVDILVDRVADVGIPWGSEILDCGAGDGAILDRLPVPKNSITAIELHPVRAEILRTLWPVRVVEGDYLTLQAPRLFPTVVGNPPFSLFLEFWRRSMDLLEPGGDLFLLGRLGIMEGKKRREMFDGSGWRHLWVIPKRGNFRYKLDGSSSQTDSTAYGWFHWSKGYEGGTMVERVTVPGYDYDLH